MAKLKCPRCGCTNFNIKKGQINAVDCAHCSISIAYDGLRDELVVKDSGFWRDFEPNFTEADDAGKRFSQ